MKLSDIQLWPPWAKALLILAAVLAIVGLMHLCSCSSERVKAEADSLRWNVETGKGNSNGNVGAGGYMATNDASWDTTWVSVGLSGDLFPHEKRDDTDLQYHSFLVMERLEKRLRAVEAQPKEPEPAKKPIEPVSTEEPAEKILGMSPGVFASVLTTLVVGVIGVLQRKRIGKLIQRKKHEA